MKVLWLSHIVPYPPIGGVLQRSHNLLVELSKHHDVDLIAFIQRQPVSTYFNDYEDGIDKSKSALLQHCSKVEFLPIQSDWHRFGKHRLALRSLFSSTGYTVDWLTDRTMAALLAGLSSEYDVIHFDTISLAQYAPQLRGLKVLNHHNIESQMMLRRAERETNPLFRFYYALEGRKLRHYEARTAEWFDLHITCSQLDGQRLQSIKQHTPFEEVPNGVNPEFLETDYLHCGVPSHLLFAGRFSAYANQSAARRIVDSIWPKVKEKLPDARLTLAGSGPGNYLLRRADQLKDVEVTGFVEDIKPYFRDAGIFVCPIDDGGGTRLKVLDAMAMGTAVVAHPVACEGLRLIDQQHVLLASTPEEFVSSITRLAQDEGLRSKIVRAGRQFVEEHYSYSRIGNQYSDALETLASGERSCA